MTLSIPAAFAAEPSLRITQAWAPAAAKGGDSQIYMTVQNSGPEDALLRARCEVANFSEMHVVDHGEGFPSQRPVKSIPLVGNATTTLTADSYNVAILQITRDLNQNDVFDCVMRFRDAGPLTIGVTVRSQD